MGQDSIYYLTVILVAIFNALVRWVSYITRPNDKFNSISGVEKYQLPSDPDDIFEGVQQGDE